MTVVAIRPGATSTRPAPPRFSRVVAKWPVILPLLLMFVSDYKFRQRAVNDSLGGRPDIAVMIEAAVYLAVAVFLMSEYMRQARRVRVSASLLALWGWGVTMFLSAFISPFPVLATVRGGQLMVMCFLASMISAVATREDMLDLVHAFLGLVVASVGIGVAVPFPPVTYNTAGRFTWFFVHPVISGAYLAIAIVLALGFALRPIAPARWPRNAYFGLAAVYAFALLRNETRGSIAATVVGVIVVVMLSAPRQKRAGRVAAIAASVAFIGLIALPQIIHYLARGESTAKLSTLNSRTDLWGEAWNLFGQHPLTGWGIGATRGLFLQTIGLGGAHNAVINVLVDGGILGIVWWLAAVVGVVVAVTHLGRVAAWQPEVPMLAGVVAVLLVNAITIEGLGASANVSSMWLILLLGWMTAARRRDAGIKPR